MLDLNGLDIEEIAMALADQTDYDHRWLINPRSGRLVLWTSDTGIDGEHPVDLEDLDLIPIDPVPSYVWYQDMVDFADGISDARTGDRLARTLRGPGAFRRFKNEIYKHPHLISPWQTLREARALGAGPVRLHHFSPFPGKSRVLVQTPACRDTSPSVHG